MNEAYIKISDVDGKLSIEVQNLQGVAHAIYLLNKAAITIFEDDNKEFKSDVEKIEEEIM